MPKLHDYVPVNGDVALHIIDQLPISRLEFWQACGYKATTDRTAGALLFHLQQNRLPKHVFQALLSLVPVKQRQEALKRLCEGQEGPSEPRLSRIHQAYLRAALEGLVEGQE